jgi:PAS domain S-box-containing protein
MAALRRSIVARTSGHASRSRPEGTLREVSARSAVATSGEARLIEALVASAPDALYVVDADGDIRLANPAALAILGYASERQLIGRPSHATIHYKRPDGSAYPDEECPLLRTAHTGETVRVDRDWFVRSNGSMVAVAYASAPLRIAARRGAIVSFRDIGEQLRAEEALAAKTVHEARLREMRASRARLVAAADAERRRLARDLHDRAQQRLVQALIELQLAQRSWSAEPDAALHHLEQGLGATKAAITELRELSQGIHPHVLIDRGLRAALGALADRAPCPVQLDVPADRFAPAVEATVYFLVAESLTNIAKHARADEARVTVWREGGDLVVEVGDDGVGGARKSEGSGLRGLADRVAAAGGGLEILSPPGGPTLLRARLPLNAAGT